MTHESWKERVEELLALSGRLPVPPRRVGRAVQLVPVRPALARDGRVHELPKDRRSRVLIEVSPRADFRWRRGTDLR